MTDKALQNFNISSFQKALMEWYRANKRDLPWRANQDPYKVWVSEIMLQQTKVDTVIPYFQHFMSKYPTPHDLAYADEQDVLKHGKALVIIPAHGIYKTPFEKLFLLMVEKCLIIRKNWVH